MAGLFSQAMIDPETSELVRTGLYYVYETDGTTLAIIFTDQDEGATVEQPLTTTAAGNALFFAVGGFYKLSRGGDPVLVQVSEDSEQALQSNFSDYLQHTQFVDFDPGCYFADAHQNYAIINSDFDYTDGIELSTISFIYKGSDDITITFPNSSPHLNATWPIYNCGSGSVEIVVEDPGQLLNVNSHTKVSGAGAVGFVTQVNDTNEEDALYVLGGVTSA